VRIQGALLQYVLRLPVVGGTKVFENSSVLRAVYGQLAGIAQLVLGSQAAQRGNIVLAAFPGTTTVCSRGAI
jgi:hypothetical protein